MTTTIEMDGGESPPGVTAPSRSTHSPGWVPRFSPTARDAVAMRLSDLDGRATVSVEEVASLLGLGRTATYEAIRRGQVPSRRLGRRLVVPVPALLQWLGVAVSPSRDDGSGTSSDRPKEP